MPPPRRFINRLRRAEAALPRREANFDELSEAELDLLEGHLRRAQEVGSDGVLAEMSETDRLALETAASKVKYEWSWL